MVSDSDKLKWARRVLGARASTFECQALIRAVEESGRKWVEKDDVVWFLSRMTGELEKPVAMLARRAEDR